MRYLRNAAVSSSRLTLRKAGLLYLICAIQPALLLALLVLGRFLYQTPIDQRFGLVSLLAGVDKTGPDALRGAAFSGTLRAKVPLGIEVDGTGHQRERVRYTIGALSGQEGDWIRPSVAYG